MIRAAPFGEVVNRARGAAPGPLLLALVLAGAGSLLVAARLRLLAHALGLSPSLRSAAYVNLSALFYGLFLPGGSLTGGAIRFYRLAGSEGKVAAAAGALVWDRLFATLALALVGLVFWLLAPASKPGWPGLAFALVATAVAGVMSIGGNVVAQAARPKPGGHAAALALSISAQVLGTALYIALAASLGVLISPLTLGWIRAAVMLVVLLPVSISGIGIREGALMVLLAPEGVGEVSAVALGILVFATTVLVPGLVGGVSEGVRLLRRGDTAGESRPRDLEEPRSGPAAGPAAPEQHGCSSTPGNTSRTS